MELYFKESLKEADESSLDTLDIAPLQRLISYINENKTKWIDPYCLNKFGLLNEVDLQTISVKTKGQASNSLWAEIRRGMMTASNFHRIRSRMQTLKSNPTESAGALLRHLCCVPPAYASLPRSLAWGRKYEAKAIKHYEKLMAKRHRRMKVRTTGLCIFDENFLMGVSPDAVCSCSCEKGTCSRQWLVEVKCPYTDKYKHPKAAAVHNGCFYSVVQKKWILSRTHKHYSQVQGLMGVMKCKSLDLVIYTTKGIAVVPVPFDYVFFTEMKKDLCLFQEGYLVPYIKKMYGS